MKTKPAQIKCRFCDWSTNKWRTTKRGKRVEEYAKLRRHMEFQHPEKLEEVDSRLE